MNSAFVGYEELSRSRTVLPPRSSASVDNTLLDLLNSSYPTQPHSLIAKFTVYMRGRMGAYYTVWYCSQGSTHFGMIQWKKPKDAMTAINASAL